MTGWRDASSNRSGRRKRWRRRPACRMSAMELSCEKPVQGATSAMADQSSPTLTANVDGAAQPSDRMDQAQTFRRGAYWSPVTTTTLPWVRGKLCLRRQIRRPMCRGKGSSYALSTSGTRGPKRLGVSSSGWAADDSSLDARIPRSITYARVLELPNVNRCRLACCCCGLGD